MPKQFFDLLGLAEMYCTAFSNCPTVEGCRRIAAEMNESLEEYRVAAKGASTAQPSVAAVLSEYVVAVSDRVARSSQQPPAAREVELYRQLEAKL